MEAGTLSRSKAVQGRVRADEVVEKDEHGNEVVDVVVEALHADVLNPMQRLDRHLIGKVTVAHNGARRA